MTRWHKIILLAIAFAFLTALLVITGMPLRTDSAPLGIVSMQLAGNAVNTGIILQSWGPAGRESAWLNLIVDFPYLVTYGWLLLALCRLAASVGDGRMASLGRWCAAGAVLAAMCDAVENIALLHELHAGAGNFAAGIAWGFASVKFLLLAIVGLYLLSAAGRAIARRIF